MASATHAASCPEWPACFIVAFSAGSVVYFYKNKIKTIVYM
jgi:hypothetical protein